jgi:lipopolysaccharide/colanic/teichoic acid biosynthesis glycosyltransferase
MHYGKRDVVKTHVVAEASAPWPPPAGASYPAAKRTLDIVIASTALVVGAPIWAAIGAAIRLTSPGPILYRGPVVGLEGRAFTYFKFRSMREGDDSHHREWLQEFVRSDRPFLDNEGLPVYKAVNDPRITPVGRLLRRLSLDEVPQLVNVIRGEMSIVGPRPPIPAEFDAYDETANRRLAVKPGITGLYQVTARSRVPFSEMLAIDLDYIRRRSLRLDLWIVLRTVGAMLKGDGAV